MKKRTGAQFYTGLVTLLFCIGIIMQPFGVAYAETGAGKVEHVSEGITIKQNWDGSKSLTMELTDKQIESMNADDGDVLLVDKGDAITSTDETVDTQINNDFKQNDELVTVAKDGTSISFSPIVDESNFAKENEPKVFADVITDGEISSAALQTPEVSAGEAEDSAPQDIQDVAKLSQKTKLTAATDEEAGNSPPPEPTSTADGGMEAVSLPQAAQEAAPTENPTPKPTSEPTPAAEPTPLIVEPSAALMPKEDIKPELRKEGYLGSAFESATYEGVFDPTTDIRLKAKTNGIKEDIIINEYAKNNVFEYRVDLNGLTPEQHDQEIWLFDKDKNRVAMIAAPFMTDAAGAYSEDITVSIRQDANSYIIRYEPDSSWLTPQRAYPVIVDPSVYYDSVDAASLGLEDNYVSNISPDAVNTYNREYFKVGNDEIAINQAYIRCVIPEDIVNKGSNILIQDAQVNMYETSGKTSGNTFSIHRVESGWNSRTITWNNSPHILDKAYDTQYVNGSEWYSFDLTEMFGEYFNTFNQIENCGFALVCDANDYGDYREFVSADTPSYRMTFSMTYFEEIPNTGIRVTPHTNGVNSGSGYFDVNWNSVEGAGGYYIGIWDGKEYEYLNVGNTTSFTTKGRSIWPTAGEITAGSCKLHLNGGGAELPMIPAHLYAKNNPGSSYANDLNYYFKVVPHNGT
ncbi:MAG: DNRLRE domain-containing protein, partial [Christensenella sp.]